jgi:hypothetical protein
MILIEVPIKKFNQGEDIILDKSNLRKEFVLLPMKETCDCYLRKMMGK